MKLMGHTSHVGRSRNRPEPDPVQICCKGAPRQDRPREEARNINDSLPAPRRDRGLCNRFGQPAAATALEEGIREPDGDHDGCTDGRAGPAERSPAREDTLRSRPGGADRP